MNNMRYVLEFNYPEEREEFETYLNAPKYHSLLSEVAQMLRQMTKYEAHPTEDRLLTDAELALANAIREKYFKLVEEQDLNDL
jgi:hypothetical protein